MNGEFTLPRQLDCAEWLFRPIRDFASVGLLSTCPILSQKFRPVGDRHTSLIFCNHCVGSLQSMFGVPPSLSAAFQARNLCRIMLTLCVLLGIILSFLATCTSATRIQHLPLHSSPQWSGYSASSCVVSPRSRFPFNNVGHLRRPLASLIRPPLTDPHTGIQLSPSDLAALEAVAVCLEWPLVPKTKGEHKKGNCMSKENHDVGHTHDVQFAGVLPPLGKPEAGGSWEPVFWHGRSIPCRYNAFEIMRQNGAKDKRKSFFVRLLQPNLYVS